jgi:hypothetical protein
MDDEQIESELAERVWQLVASAINDSRGELHRSIERARDRLHFIRPDTNTA